MKRQGGFTLVEIAVALSIAAVIMGFVIVRVDGWSSRQALVSTARTLGNTIRMYRERAQDDEATYSLKIDRDRGTYAVTGEGQTLRAGRLGMGQSFGKAVAGEQEVPAQFTLQLSPRGILPETRITLTNATKESVTLTIGSLANEIGYSEVESK